MDIRKYIETFIGQSHRYRPYSKIYKSLLTGGKPYSFNTQYGYEDSNNLAYTIRESVQAYTSNKDTAISLYKDFLAYLMDQGVPVPTVYFPQIPVSNTFERLMFIAKYLQGPHSRISDLPSILWVSPRTIEEDISRLRGFDDPIQVCGKKFFIPNTDRQDGKLRFESTAHPFFLAQNLTQVLVMLKGLKTMAENPLYEPYALQTGIEIWRQLSPYARSRISFVLNDLMPEDYEWYEKLDTYDSELFNTEMSCSNIRNEGANVIIDCMKNQKPFCVEYEENGEIHLYKDCVMENGSYSANPSAITINCSEGSKRLIFDKVIRSAYTAEELAAE